MWFVYHSLYLFFQQNDVYIFTSMLCSLMKQCVCSLCLMVQTQWKKCVCSLQNSLFPNILIFFKHLWCIKMFSNDIYAIFLCTIWDSATYPLQIFSHNVYVSCIFNQQNLLFFNVNFIQTDLFLLYPNQFIKSWGGSCCVFLFFFEYFVWVLYVLLKK